MGSRRPAVWIALLGLFLALSAGAEPLCLAAFRNVTGGLAQLFQRMGFGPGDILTARDVYGREEAQRLVDMIGLWATNQARIDVVAREIAALDQGGPMNNMKKERRKALVEELRGLTGMTGDPALLSVLGEANRSFADAGANPGGFLEHLVRNLGSRRYARFLKVESITDIHSDRTSVLGIPYLLREMVVKGPGGRRTIGGRFSPPAPTEALERVREVVNPIMTTARAVKGTRLPTGGSAITVIHARGTRGEPILIVGISGGPQQRETLAAYETQIRDAVRSDPRIRQLMGNFPDVRVVLPPAADPGAQGFVSGTNVNGTGQTPRPTCGEPNTFRLFRGLEVRREGIQVQTWGTFWAGDTANNNHPYLHSGGKPRVDRNWMEPCGSCEANLFYHIITRGLAPSD